ncbi:MAG TPA: aldo/keto reductase [Thermoplasmata archaeon]|nr:aldo/keto reductase [Thermoplasmata archaeon]
MTPTERPPRRAAKKKPIGSATRKPPSRAPTVASIETVEMPGGARPHPELGLGLWALGRWTPEDEARTKATIGRAYEHGIRWFDTAEVYGNGRSERLLGEVLNRVPHAAPDAYVVTKVSWEHLHANQVRASLIGSLERMARRSVDLYLVHAPDSRVPLAETMGALEALWKDGKIGAIGVSNFSVEELEEASRHLAEAKIVVNQLRYNLFLRDDVDPVRDYCRSHGILIEAYSPLARGLLLGRYLDGGKVPREVRDFAHRLFEPDILPEMRERGTALRDLAADAKVPLGSIALHWVRKMGAVPVFGASRAEQIDSILGAWAVRPPDRVLDRADRIARGERA